MPRSFPCTLHGFRLSGIYQVMEVLSVRIRRPAVGVAGSRLGVEIAYFFAGLELVG